MGPFHFSSALAGVADLPSLTVAPRSNDMHHRAVYTGDTLNLWLAHRCDFYGAILVLAVSCFAVGMKVSGFLYTRGSGGL